MCFVSRVGYTFFAKINVIYALPAQRIIVLCVFFHHFLARFQTRNLITLLFRELRSYFHLIRKFYVNCLFGGLYKFD